MKNNTLVMFFCDNGPKGNPKKNSSSQAGLALRGGKGQIYEGGTRVPAAIRWPAKIEPGSKCEDCLSVLDLLPTLTAASGISHGAEKPLDGSNRWPLFQGQKTEPAPIIIAGGRGVMAAIEDPLKLIKTANGDELYNIRKDPEETTDIASDQPESVERLNTILKPFSEAGPRSKRGKKGKQKGKSKGKKERSKGKPTAETRQDYQLPPSPQPVGEAGIAWYTTWDTAMAEATRSKRPIFFMSAAGTCSGVSGIF